ncbi:protein adenylyltransferase SelO [Candidatus Magnetaquicoccus inordinatus]|uniref:protein adenylyltransferase SelO n=1 Tax=Candidatus Magnetaquicoccus inordinatus TaxID=2496818 RepID=UPI00102C7266|nr:YdiU family protein [Candidatus Magnetaquicoccus inordinatus]
MAEHASSEPPLGFEHSYQSLPEHFYSRLSPEPVAQPQLLLLNEELVEAFSWDREMLRQRAAQWFSGNRLPGDASPIALAYAGDQFGQFVPQLGDGRAHLLGEVVDRQGKRYDLQLKGSGRTPYSRRGDGRACLAPMLREYLVSEAMHALGIPSSRSLAVVATGEWVMREQPLAGAVLTRVAASHLRVGTIQYFAARQDWSGVRMLAEYTLNRHYPEWCATTTPCLDLLQVVSDRQARLLAQWLQVGFIHGVMNTDNMTLSGETIDYGPCAFMDLYDPATVFSSIDHWGRYAYGNQPAMATWNLRRLAEALLPVIEAELPGQGRQRAQTILTTFPELLQEYWMQGMRDKLALPGKEAGDGALIEELLAIMYRGKADYTLTFRRLADALAAGERGVAEWCAAFTDPQEARQWFAEWLVRLREDRRSDAERVAALNGINPLYIPRNYLVEEALSAAVAGAWQPFQQLFRVLRNPFQEQEGMARYSAPPPASWGDYQTFCGT